MRLLLDTTVVLDALRGRRGRRALLSSVVRSEGELYLSAMTVAEIYIAVRPNEEADTRRFLSSLHQLSVTPQIAQRAGRLKARHPDISMTDLLLAATAIEHELEFLTDHRDRYPIEGLAFYRPPTPTVESLLAETVPS